MTSRRCTPRPLTPWAQRYGYTGRTRRVFFVDDETHSGLSPLWPFLHPRFYADQPSDTDETRPRTLSDFDRLFSSEKFQRKHLQGMEMWELGPLMHSLWFSDATGLISGGHNRAAPGSADNAANRAAREAGMRVFRAERIKVDESRWLKFLGKDRWLDLVHRSPVLGGKDWSVDIPAVWEELRVVIELVNRIFRAMIVDRHSMLEAVMFGILTDWGRFCVFPTPDRDARILLTRPYLYAVYAEAGLNRPMFMDYIDDLTAQEWEDRLEAMLHDQMWSFSDNKLLGTNAWAVTLTTNRCITLELSPITLLLSGRLTLAERCLTTFQIAVSMVHELFHSIFMTRRTVANFPQIQLFLSNRLLRMDPMVDYDGMNEIGFAAELRIFGGETGSTYADLEEIPVGVVQLPWPRPETDSDAYTFEAPNHSAFDLQRTISVVRIPALYASKLLSEEFWNDASIAQKSAEYFHFNPLIKTETPWLLFRQDDINPPFVRDPLPPMLYPGEQELVDHWNERHRIFANMRGRWNYEAHRDEWEKSPWSEVELRMKIKEFELGFARRNELDCLCAAGSLATSVYWTEDREGYINDIPPVNTMAHPNRWVFHAIGLLMLAALPIRKQPVQNNQQIHLTFHYRPSTTCNFAPFTLAMGTEQKDGRVVSERFIFDPLGRQPDDSDDDEAGGRIENFTQADLIALVTKLLDYMAAQDVAVSTPWLREITRAAAMLRQQRGDISRTYPNVAYAKSRWADSWDLKIPRYCTTKSRFRDGRWEEVP